MSDYEIKLLMTLNRMAGTLEEIAQVQARLAEAQLEAMEMIKKAHPDTTADDIAPTKPVIQ